MCVVVIILDRMEAGERGGSLLGVLLQVFPRGPIKEQSCQCRAAVVLLYPPLSHHGKKKAHATHLVLFSFFLTSEHIIRCNMCLVCDHGGGDLRL